MGDATDPLVRRVRWAAAGVLCGLLLWAGLRLVPAALAQTGPEPGVSCYEEPPT